MLHQDVRARIAASRNLGVYLSPWAGSDRHGFCVDAATFTRVFSLSESRRVLPSGDAWRMVVGAGLNQVSVVASPTLTLVRHRSWTAGVT
jgi:hypothetical protein